MMSMFFFMTQFLQEVRGFSALRTGFAFLPMAVSMFVLTRTMPALLPRIGPRPLAVTGAVLLISGLAWLTRLSPDSGYLDGVLGPMLLMGFGVGIGFVPLPPVIMATVPPADAGAAGGIMQTMQQTGVSLGLAMLVTVFGSAIRNAGHVTPTAALVTGMTHAFVASTLFATATLLVALTFRPRAANHP
jgi:hypothetical protein